MEYKDLIKLDVTNLKDLKDLGFDKSKYYCGNYGFQKYYTKLRNVLKKAGIPFPFNKACFKHDCLYHTIPSVKQKIWIDFIFLIDMIKLLNNSKSVKVKLWRKHLIKRMIFYYIMVNLLTPIYMFQGKIKKTKFFKKISKVYKK